MSEHREPEFDHAKLDKLYTTPSHSLSAQAPRRFPGVTPESTATLLETLKDNHVKWHIFFNERGWHNHASHHLLALYHLGANGDNIKAAYATHTSFQRRAYESPGPITRDNFHEHLADEDYYDAYLKFFSDELLDKGAAAVIEEFIFSPKANIEPPKPGKEPMQMASRFLAGLFHPLIHAGYGCEFGLLGQLAEGLADTAVTGLSASAATPPTLLKYVAAAATDAANATVSRLTSLLPSFVIDQVQRAVQPTSSKTPSKSVHALTLVSRLMHDDRFSHQNLELPPPVESEDDTSLEQVLHLRGEELAEIVEEWTVDGTNAAEVEAKIEELFWTSVVLFGIAGWGAREKSRTGTFNADFFFVHLVTSSLFLPSIVAYLSSTSTAILLRSYLLDTLALYVARGSPALPVADFFDAVAVAPAPPADSLPHNKPADGTLTADNRTPSAWLAIAQSTLEHPDDHLCKLQRSLAHFDSLYGATPAGHFKKLGVELDGIERLDGSLFVRVAGLAQERLGWMREGQERQQWDF